MHTKAIILRGTTRTRYWERGDAAGSINWGNKAEKKTMGQGQDHAGARNNGCHKNYCQINQKKFHPYSFLGWEGMNCTRQREIKLKTAPAKKGIL